MPGKSMKELKQVALQQELQSQIKNLNEQLSIQQAILASSFRIRNNVARARDKLAIENNQLRTAYGNLQSILAKKSEQETSNHSDQCRLEEAEHRRLEIALNESRTLFGKTKLEQTRKMHAKLKRLNGQQPRIEKLE